jgi:hypothetical protein
MPPMSAAEPTRPAPRSARPAPGVFSTEVDGELVLLEPKSGRYFGLDRVGLAFWEALVDAPDVERAKNLLLERFDVEEGRLTEDISRLVDGLEDAGLLDVDRD